MLKHRKRFIYNDRNPQKETQVAWYRLALAAVTEVRCRCQYPNHSLYNAFTYLEKLKFTNIYLGMYEHLFYDDSDTVDNTLFAVAQEKLKLCEETLGVNIYA